MARIRSIKPEFWTSETIARLDLLDRLLFIGLWNYADDEGRGKDNPALVRATVFPLDESVTLQRVHEGLRSLQSAGLIVRYMHDGKNVLAITNWLEHQRVSHPTPSKFPAPDQAQEYVENPPEDLASPPEALVPEGNRERNREQGKELSPSQPSVDDTFEEFWQAYPRRGGVRAGKAAAQKQWSKLKLDDRLLAMSGLPLYTAAKGEYPEDAERYLKHRRWVGLEPAVTATRVDPMARPAIPDYVPDDVPDALPMAAGVSFISEMRGRR